MRWRAWHEWISLAPIGVHRRTAVIGVGERDHGKEGHDGSQCPLQRGLLLFRSGFFYLFDK